MRVKARNQGLLFLFCALVGGFAGGVIWLFLKIMAVGTEALWEVIPGSISLPFYPVWICTLGGALIGMLRKKYGDYPEELNDVLGKVKTEKHYDYKKMPVMILAALLPLLIGSSVGPEAGMAGIIVGLCYWAGDNLKFARQYAKEYSEIGVAVTLGVLFHSPLFGIFQVAENQDADDQMVLPKTSKLLLYSMSLAGGMGSYLLLSHLFGKGLAGFPAFQLEREAQWLDYIMIIVYIAAGSALALVYKISHDACRKAAAKIPQGLRETAAGLVIGIVATFLPVVLFSGEEEMGRLPETFGMYIPLIWMLIALLKIILTNFCIQSGLKGGHFFPVIFAGVCFAYGLAAAIFPTGGHEVFAAAVVTAALLGGTLRKPLAVTMLLMICFPVKLCIWIFLAAAVSSRIARLYEKGDSQQEETTVTGI